MDVDRDILDEGLLWATLPATGHPSHTFGLFACSMSRFPMMSAAGVCRVASRSGCLALTGKLLNAGSIFYDLRVVLRHQPEWSLSKNFLQRDGLRHEQQRHGLFRFL